MTPPLVIKVGGAAAEDQRSAPALWDAVADLHRAEPGGVVLVHGGGKAVDRHLERLGIVSQRREGIRLTPPEHMDQIAAILAGVVNSRIVPVLSSIGMDDRGGLLNVNADDAAAGVARRLRARALLLLTDVPGIMDAPQRLVPRLDPAGVEGLIASGTITGGMIVKARAAVEAARRIGAPVVILGGNDPSALADWAAGRPVGTTITPDSDTYPRPTSRGTHA